MNDPRAVVEYRVPAGELEAGDVLNTSPGGPDDWQLVIAVHTKSAAGEGPTAELMGDIGGRYVMVELTDVAAVDSNVYLTDDTAMVFGAEGEEDSPALDVVSDADDRRIYLYTVYELVTVRGRE